MRDKSTWNICARLMALSLAACGLHADTPPVDLSPNSLNLGSQIVGVTSGPGTVTVTNHLTTSLTILSVTTTGDFAQTNNCGFPLAPGHTCTVKVTFTPTAAGTRTGQLFVNDDATTSPQMTSLSGTGSVSGLASISLSPANPSIPLGLKQQFAATGYFKNGTVADLTISVNWNSSNPAVAAISSSTGQGQATSLVQGTTAITASMGSVSGSTILTVTPPALVSLAVIPSNPSIPLGAKQQFSAIGTFTNGDARDLSTSVNWNSSNAAVATINSQALATSLAEGSTAITASLGSVSSSGILTVSAPALVSLAITPANPSIPLGGPQQFSAIGTFTNGDTQNLTASVAWNSSNAAVAIINSWGLTKPLAVGTTTISATTGALSASTQLTVKALVSISLSPTNSSIPLGLKQQFGATGFYSDGTVADLTSSVNWNSSNAAVAIIDSQGLAKALAVGMTTISATIAALSASTQLTVTPALVSISLSPTNPWIPLGLKQQFAAIGFFNDGTIADLTSSVNWKSSNPAVATISNSTGTQGQVTSLAQGTTAITASLGSVSGSTILTVTSPALVSLAVTPTNRAIPPGVTQQFSAIGTFTNGDIQNVTASVTWNSSNAAVAIINTNGLAKALADGTTTISAAAGVSGSTQLTVATPQDLVSIRVLPGNGSIPLTTALQFRAIGTFADGSQGDLTNSVSWNSTDSTIAAISNSAGSEGLAVSAAAGTTTISASIGSHSDSTGLNVTALVPGQARFAYVVNLHDSTVSIYLIDGLTGQLTPTGAPFFESQMSLPDAVVADPSGKFLYVADKGTSHLFAYTIDTTTGLLTPIGSPVFADAPSALAVHPSGKFLFMANAPGNVTTYSIDATGAVTLVGQTPAAAGGAASVYVDPSGKFVYTANFNANTISAYSVDTSTGLLTTIPGSPFAAGANPVFVAVHPSGDFLYAANANGQSVSAYAVDSNTGALTGIPGSPFTVGSIPTAMALDPTGKYAYVANSSSNNVSALTIDSATGVLQPIAGSPFPEAYGPFWDTVDPLSKFLYVGNFSSNDISVFAIDPDTGSLTSVGTLPTGAGPISMTLVK